MNTDAWRIVREETQDALETARAHQKKLEQDWEANAAEVERLNNLVESLTIQLEDAPEAPVLPSVPDAVEAMLKIEPRLRNNRDEVHRRLALHYREFRDLADVSQKQSVGLYMHHAVRRIRDAQKAAL